MKQDDRIKAARVRLGIAANTPLTANAIRVAAAHKLKAAHPDQGGSGDLSKIKKDRDFLMRQCTQREVCPSCGGSGYVD